MDKHLALNTLVLTVASAIQLAGWATTTFVGHGQSLILYTIFPTIFQNVRLPRQLTTSVTQNGTKMPMSTLCYLHSVLKSIKRVTFFKKKHAQDVTKTQDISD
jgi:hypothetical protein